MLKIVTCLLIQKKTYVCRTINVQQGLRWKRERKSGMKIRNFCRSNVLCPSPSHVTRTVLIKAVKQRVADKRFK